ncbi:MAG TPA: hypothetical protein GX510_04460 [Firmicutes bacterium]|nr:hypothetical protein [Candidatus Fermentithermobacillaceae bacterium]
MALHESTVNFRSLIKDLAEMYPFEVDEVVVTEIVANALDAKATLIAIDFDPMTGVLIVEDNGKGMTRSEFSGYHDFAAELKRRGTGIGFAGVGAKISFQIADRVITETRSKSFAGGSNWYLQDGRRLVWEEIQPVHLKGTGTRVEIHFRQDGPRSFQTRDDLVRLIRRHYLPLLDPTFLDLYDKLGIYSRTLRFRINGEIVVPDDLVDALELEQVREFYPLRCRKRYGYGILGLSVREYPVAPDLCGVLVCTYGKVIKQEFFGQFPGSYSPRIVGVVEVPPLVHFLTTTKTDFVKQGRHREFEEFYDPLRQEFKEWLRTLGVEPPETSNAWEAGRIEKELKKIAEEMPELGQFFGFKIQRTLFHESDDGVPAEDKKPEAARNIPPVEPLEGSEGISDEATGAPDGAGNGAAEEDEGVEDRKPRVSLVNPLDEGATRGSPVSRSARRGPKIAFVREPERPELAWVEGTNVIINAGHPSYVKVRGNAQARIVHNLFAIGVALQRFMGTDGEPGLTLVDRMMGAWGKR